MIGGGGLQHTDCIFNQRMNEYFPALLARTPFALDIIILQGALEADVEILDSQNWAITLDVVSTARLCCFYYVFLLPLSACARHDVSTFGTIFTDSLFMLSQSATSGARRIVIGCSPE